MTNLQPFGGLRNEIPPGAKKMSMFNCFKILLKNYMPNISCYWIIKKTRTF